MDICLWWGDFSGKRGKPSKDARINGCIFVCCLTLKKPQNIACIFVTSGFEPLNLRQSCDNRVDVWLIHGPMAAADFMTCQTIKNLRQLPNTETFTYADFYGCKTI